MVLKTLPLACGFIQNNPNQIFKNDDGDEFILEELFSETRTAHLRPSSGGKVITCDYFRNAIPHAQREVDFYAI